MDAGSHLPDSAANFSVHSQIECFAALAEWRQLAA
jgi:hypothetical protein